MKEKIIELIANKEFVQLKHLLARCNSADVSEIIDELPIEDGALVLRLLDKDESAEVFSRMEADTQESIINVLKDGELKRLMDNLYADDMVDMISEMPAVMVKRILSNVDKETRGYINELLKYPKDSAGSLMTIEFVDLKAGMTVHDAFDRIRKVGDDKETIYTCYVIDGARHLLGALTVKDMLLAPIDACVEDLMETNLVKVHTLDDQEEVAQAFDKYDYLALPVVDNENRLVGIITIDDALDVIHEETTEDFELMNAIQPSEESYLKMSAWQHSKHRIVWLLFLMLSSTITGSIIAHYEQAFAAIPILVAFIPMIMGTGGNSGAQSSTLIIRGLATNELEVSDVVKCWMKEIKVSLICGCILAIINGVRITFQYQNMLLALVVGLTLIVTVVIAKSLGCLLPMVAKTLKMDPAIMASPLITTIVDTASILIYFNIAVALLKI